MRHLFDLDSPVMSALSTLLDFFVLSILTLLCSLPVVTAGASWCALYSSMADMVAGAPMHIRGYFSHSVSYTHLTLPTSVLFLVFCLLMALAFLPPVINANPSLRFLQLWKAALVQGIGRLPRSLAILAVLVIPAVVLFFSPRWFWLLIFVWSFLWPAAAGYLWARLTVRLFGPLVN